MKSNDRGTPGPLPQRTRNYKTMFTVGRKLNEIRVTLKLFVYNIIHILYTLVSALHRSLMSFVFLTDQLPIRQVVVLNTL